MLSAAPLAAGGISILRRTAVFLGESADFERVGVWTTELIALRVVAVYASRAAAANLRS